MTGARAADAVVVAEPEPVEYVRVCDVYGAGYYYIPGTETCLKVGGYIRYDIGVGALGHEDVYDRRDWYFDRKLDYNDTYYKRARAHLRLDARSETELGTLRGYMALSFDHKTIQGGVDGDEILTASSTGIDHAIIELGGFRIGKTNSLFDTFTNGAGNVINDGLIPYAPGGTHQIAYTYNGGNGFTAASLSKRATTTNLRILIKTTTARFIRWIFRPTRSTATFLMSLPALATPAAGAASRSSVPTTWSGKSSLSRLAWT